MTRKHANRSKSRDSTRRPAQRGESPSAASKQRTERGRSKPKASKSKSPAKPVRAKASRPDAKAHRERPRHPRPKSIAPPIPPQPETEASEELGIGSPVVPPVAPPSQPPSAPPETPAPESPAEVSAQIRALEARLDTLIRRATQPADTDEPPPSVSQQVTARARDVVERLASVVPPDGTPEESSSLFTNPYYIRTWGPRSLRSRTEEVDEFGLDPEFYARVRPVLEFVYRRYFRVELEGVTHVPAEGRAVIVANHSGTVPLDGAMLRIALKLDHPAQRELRWLAEDFVYYLPFIGVWMSRVGAVRACHENGERLLSTNDTVLAVFPEGARGIGKLFRDRYRLERFGRGGFVRLCLRTQTPMIPCAIIGAEETNPMLYRIESAARAVGLPYVPVTPTFPWLGPLGLLPAPTKWKIRFGEPIPLDEYGPESADDHVLVGRLSERVQTAIGDMLRDGLGQRKSVWFG